MKIYETFSGKHIILHDDCVAITEIDPHGDKAELKLVKKSEFEQWMLFEYKKDEKSNKQQNKTTGKESQH